MSSEVDERGAVEQSNLERFIDSIVDYAILSLDPNGRISSWNRGAERLKGYQADEAIGQHFSIFYTEEDRRRGLPQELLRKAEAEGHVEHTGWRVRKDGRHFWGDVVITAIRDDHGALLGYTKITRDLTERRAAEEREHQLTIDLERANRLKSEFLANMSHEVRTPLNGIIGMLTLLLDTDLSTRQLDLLQSAASSSRALLRIVNDILDFSKIEAGKLELDELPFDPREVALEVRDLFAPQARGAGLSLECNIDEAVPNISGDPGRLRQVLANLVSNAIKFTSSGSVTCSVERSEAHDDGTVTLRFSVTDTGVGIDEASRSRLFEAFAQADPSTTRHYGGTGLGLTICRQLVDLFGSELHVESDVGVGSEFWFAARFPVAEEAPRNDAPVERFPADGADPLHGLVLVAEDNPVNQRVLGSFLQKLGCDIVIAENGEEALRCMREHTFDVVMMDCHMPALDGFETTRRIRAADAPMNQTPVIAVTASALPEERSRCFAAGMNDFIAKPVSPADLQRVLAPYIGTSLFAPEPTYGDMLRDAVGPEMDALVATFVDATERQLGEVDVALATSSFARVRELAHSIKGSGAAVGAEELARAMEHLEASAKRERIDEVRIDLDRARGAFDRAREELGHYP